jgi:hypothetical protein
MLSTQYNKYIVNQAGPCSDCGKMAVRLSRVVDQHTSSALSLCPNCIQAFIQRQHMPSECCAE